MKKSPKNPKSAPQEEDAITKKNDELQQDELNKVTGGHGSSGSGKVILGLRKSSGGDVSGKF